MSANLDFPDRSRNHDRRTGSLTGRIATADEENVKTMRSTGIAARGDVMDVPFMIGEIQGGLSGG